MRVRMQFPVPVRWRPARSPADRIDFHAGIADAEIPEIEEGAIDEARRRFNLAEGTLTLWLHEGRAWQRPQAGTSSLDAFPWWRPGALSAELNAMPTALGRFAAAGSPLRAAAFDQRRSHDPQGTPLPDAVLARAFRDHADLARAAAVDYVRTRFLTDGRSLYVALPVPVLVPYAPGGPRVERGPGRADPGASFERDRLGLIPGYLGLCGPVPELAALTATYLARRLPDVPCPGDDIARFVNGAPAFVESLHAEARTRSRRRGAAMPDQEGQLSRIRGMTEAGLVGAVGRAAFREAATTVASVCETLAGDLGDRIAETKLRRLMAYARGVVLPSLPPPETPDEDAELLSGLSPSP
jgi:hypothetical protein